MIRNNENPAIQSRPYSFVVLLIALLVIGCAGSGMEPRTTATTGALTIGTNGTSATSGATTGALTVGTNGSTGTTVQ